jgi:small ligand-binding sensory domain FIST
MLVGQQDGESRAPEPLGSRLFSVPDPDAAVVSEKLGGLPLVGFNCAGEIGPIGGKNFLHGFPASIALFVDA